ncbi:MAG: hypothetical protein LBI14_09630 [Treponema sp.]|jgi:hypothetical protein|nr:hypothetical protein [Treponema sp.]
MANRIALLKVMFLLMCMGMFNIIPLFAQDRAGFEDLWVCPVFETGFYGVSNPSFGSGLAVGYGDRMAFGIKVVYWRDMGEVRALELNVLVRHYFFGNGAGNPGLFLQFSGGPAIFINPNQAATISAGLSVGWRFHLSKYFFIEPAIRGGYPYFVTAGLSAGVRF